MNKILCHKMVLIETLIQIHAMVIAGVPFEVCNGKYILVYRRHDFVTKWF